MQKYTNVALIWALIYLKKVKGNHRLNMELDLQSIFGLLCIAVLIG